MRPTTNQWLSYLITFAIYTITINWIVAAIMMVGVSFHECGHLWAAKKMGLKTGGFFLLPFIGGAALIQDRYRKYSHQAFTVMMGPVWGAIISFAFYGIYLLTGSAVMGEAAELLALINLFNLAPLSLLDGGQLTETINYSINETFGIGFMIVSTLAAIIILGPHNPILGILVMIYGIPYVYKAYGNWKFRRQGKEYLATPLPRLMTKTQIFQTVGAYLATGGALFFLYYTIKSSGQIDYFNLFH